MVDGSTIQCPKQGATDTGQGCLVWPDVLGQGPGHSSTHFTDCPQMCALCRQAPLSLTPAQRDEGLQLDKATDETGLLSVIHAAALGLSVCPSVGRASVGSLDLCVLLMAVLWWLPCGWHLLFPQCCSIELL